MFLGWIVPCVESGAAEYSHYSAFLQEMSKTSWVVVHWEEIVGVDPGL